MQHLRVNGLHVITEEVLSCAICNSLSILLMGAPPEHSSSQCTHHSSSL
jgi:hypothetical protein